MSYVLEIPTCTACRDPLADHDADGCGDCPCGIAYGGAA